MHLAALSSFIVGLVVFYYGSRIVRRLQHIEVALYRSTRRENRIMDNLDSIMEAVAAQTTLVGSVVEFINGLEASAVSPEAKAAILDALSANSVALESAIAANVTPVTP